MKFIRFELRRLYGFLCRECSKESGKHGALVIFIGLKEFLNALTYLGLGVGLTILARVNLKTVARWLFGDGRPGALSNWLSSMAGKRGVGRWFFNIINHSFIESYGKTLIHWADLIRGSLIILTIGTLFAYGLTSLAIALGLYYHRKWAEYIAATASILYVPLEVYGIWVYHSWTAAAALAFNFFIIWYLCKKKNLFTGYFSFHPDLHLLGRRAKGTEEKESDQSIA